MEMDVIFILLEARGSASRSRVDDLLYSLLY
jgi:hypothetical protein